VAGRQPIVVFGAGQIAEVACWCFEHDSEFDVAAFTVDREYLGAGEVLGRPVVAFEDLAERYPPSTHAMFVAMAFGRVNQSRTDTVARVQAAGYRCVNYVSSKALVSGELVPDSNTFVMELNNLQPMPSWKANPPQGHCRRSSKKIPAQGQYQQHQYPVHSAGAVQKWTSAAV
jgi:hypothetical protein